VRGDTSDRVTGRRWPPAVDEHAPSLVEHAPNLVDVLRAERARLAALVETLRDGILLLDVEQRVTVVNQAFRQLAQVVGLPLGPSADWDALLAAVAPALVDGPTATARLRDAVSARGGVVGEEITFTDGRVVELDVVPVADGGNRWGTVVHARDVTARAVLRRGLEARNRALAEAAAMNHQFVATVAHELRGPLSSVVSFGHLLGDAEAGGLSEEQHEYLDVIDRNANRLLRMIEDLLLLSRLDSGTLQLRPAPVHLADLLATVAAHRGPAAAEAGVSLVVEVADGPPLVCDETRVHQLISNLLGNAVRFTAPGGSVAVRARPEADGWRIEVSDTGIGIPAAELSRVFSAFFRGSNAGAAPGQPGTPGSGLGLVLTRAIAELHGGTIQVASADGAGTTVIVSLPMRPARQKEVEREPTVGG